MATTQLARGLIHLHRRLRGELAKSASDEELMVAPAVAQDTMGHIEALLAFLKIDFQPEVLRPIRSRIMCGPLAYGELRVDVLRALKTAQTSVEWLTYQELTDAILAKHGLMLPAPRRKHFLQKLREAVHQLHGQGAVEPERPLVKGGLQPQQRWRLSRTLFRSR